MSTILGCIADDFTGATDLAGFLARSGARVSLRIGVPDTPPDSSAPFEVIALKSRTAPIDDAICDALAAQAWLALAGATRFFWKYCSTFDSTPEGNIGPVAEALMKQIGTDQTIYCPAFPENGRLVFMGNLFVGEQPLAESPMKDHPLTPMRDSNLMRLLAPQVVGDVGLVNRLKIAKGPAALRTALEATGCQHIIVDAIEDADLTIIAKATQHLPLLTGGSAIAMPLPALYAQDRLLDLETTHKAPTIPAAQTVILSGSSSAITNAQVGAYQATGAASFRIDPLELAKTGSEPVLTWLADQDLSKAPLIYATAEPDQVQSAQSALGADNAGRIIEDMLADCAVVARDAGARRFVVAGGETSGAVTNALGTSRLEIGPEIAPGVPWTFCESAGHDLALTLKSGNFGTKSFFTDALDILDRS